MKKLLLGLVVCGFALVLFFAFRPLAANLFDRSVIPEDEPPVAAISLEPVSYVKVTQGKSAVALYILNNTSERVVFSLGHEHPHLTFQPHTDQLAPSATREVSLHVDPECPAGETELPVYLRANVNGERIGLDTVILLEVTPGELSLVQTEGAFDVLWNGSMAPRGVRVYYRETEEAQWQWWGETPRIDPPGSLEAGDYSFEFKASLGEVESAVELLSVTVEEVIDEDEPEAPVVRTTAPAKPAEKAPEPFIPRRGTGSGIWHEVDMKLDE
jgi:hypothetical protein